APTPQGSLDRCTPRCWSVHRYFSPNNPFLSRHLPQPAFQTEAPPRANSESERITPCRTPKTPSPRSNSPPIAPIPPSLPAPVPRKARPAPPRRAPRIRPLHHLPQFVLRPLRGTHGPHERRTRREWRYRNHARAEPQLPAGRRLPPDGRQVQQLVPVL